MSDASNESKIPQVRSSVDMNIVGENILDIADFTVEKYEFKTDSTLSPELRQEAVDQIKNALWKKVEELRMRRTQILQQMFDLADETLNEVIDE